MCERKRGKQYTPSRPPKITTKLQPNLTIRVAAIRQPIAPTSKLLFNDNGITLPLKIIKVRFSYFKSTDQLCQHVLRLFSLFLNGVFYSSVIDLIYYHLLLVVKRNKFPFIFEPCLLRRILTVSESLQIFLCFVKYPTLTDDTSFAFARWRHLRSLTQRELGSEPSILIEQLGLHVNAKTDSQY